MIKLYIPKLEDLWFRQMFMADEETMSYNHNWGGTIVFKEEDWVDWYDYWIVRSEGKRFYRYLQDEANDEFVGEVAYHYDCKQQIYIADVIVYAKYRGKGFGEQGLLLLCDAAKANGVEKLYDDIAIDNPATKLFLKVGFYEEYRTDEIIMLKKEL
jgi:RimJ/RimL family protein N-acetyltransferase